jgi:hypothetical protein
MVYRSSLQVAVALALSVATTAAAQESRFTQPQAEHRLLERLAGEWQFERQTPPEAGSRPRILGTGAISAEMMGAFFVASRWAGNVYGADYEALQAIGYDVEQGKYTGYWLDSFMSFRWELTGIVDAATQELWVTTRGPAPAGGTTGFRERYRFDSADSITIIGEMQRDESWVAITHTRLTRKR